MQYFQENVSVNGIDYQIFLQKKDTMHTQPLETLNSMTTNMILFSESTASKSFYASCYQAILILLLKFAAL